MTQKLETFYGFRLELQKSFVISEFDSLKSEITSVMQGLQNTDPRHYGVYVSMCQFSFIKEKVFGIGPIEKRVKMLDITWAVCPEERHKGTIFFLNKHMTSKHYILDTPSHISTKKYQIRCGIDSKYFSESDTFRILIMAVVDTTQVSIKRRKLRLSATATPTPEYASRFINSDGRKNTKIDYFMDESVQLFLSL
jgi:hypothetical protein